MRAHKFLLLAAPVSLLLFTACAAPDGDDGNGAATATPTPTPTASGTATPVPTPTQPAITERASFTNGTEIWLCLQTQFDGSIVNIAVNDPDEAGCGEVKLGAGFTSTIDRPHFHALRLDNGGTGLNCNATDKRWNIDFQYAVDRCTGCVNEEYNFNLAPDDLFGTFCGSGDGPAPIESLTSYFSTTTQLLRVRADVGAYGSVAIEKFRIYTKPGNVFMTECTSPAVIATGGNGIFDVQCTPAVTSTTLTPGTTYGAVAEGTSDGSEYIGSFDLAHTASQQ